MYGSRLYMSDALSEFKERPSLPTDRELKDHVFPVWNPEKDEEDELHWVLSRVEDDMLPHQAEYHKEMEDALDIYEAKITPQLHRPSIRIPWSFTIIDAANAEEIDAFPDIEIDTEEEDDKQLLPILNAAKKDALYKANWESIKMDARRICRIYGWCAVRHYYQREVRLITEETPMIGEDGSITIEEKKVYDYPEDDLTFEVIDDPKRFLIDPSARDIDKAEDCALITEVNWNVFRQMVQHDKRFKNIECVVPGNDYFFKDNSLVKPSYEKNVARDKKVKILEYWNRYTDRYVMIASGVIIRSRSLVDAHKKLPFAALHLYRRPHTFYSKGIPKILESVEATYNAIISAEVQATKLAFPILVTTEDSGIDPKAVAPYPGIVLEGAMDKSKLLQLGAVPEESYRLKEKLEQLMIWITGVNYQQLFSEKQSDRVGIEALKKESMLSRINANIRENEVNFILRLGNLLIQNIMYYYPTPRIRGLLPSEDIEKMKGLTFENDDKQLMYDEDMKTVRGVLERRKIVVQGIQFNETKTSGKYKLSASRIDGVGFLIARPEFIRTKYPVKVRAVRPSAMGSSKEANKLLMLEFSTHALDVNGAAIQQGATVGPNGENIPGKPIWNQQYIERLVAEAHEINVEKALTPDGEKETAVDAIKKIGNPLMESFKKPIEVSVEEKMGPRNPQIPAQQAQAEFQNMG